MKIITKLNKSKYLIRNGIQYFKFTLYFSKKLLKILGWDETTPIELAKLSKGEIITITDDCVLMKEKK